MADELDPRLEARLREALHAEADALPLTISAEDLAEARRRRGGRRRALPVSLLGAAAVVAILVVVGTLWRGDASWIAASPSPSVMPAADDCVPLSSERQGRTLLLDNGFGVGSPVESLGTLIWHAYDGHTVSGAPDGWRDVLDGGIAVDDQTGLTFDPLQHCFASYGVEVVSVDALRAAVAAGSVPVQTSTVDVSDDGRRVRVSSLPLGAYVIRFDATWRTADGKDDTDAWLIPVVVLADGPVGSASPTATAGSGPRGTGASSSTCPAGRRTGRPSLPSGCSG